MTYRHFKLIFTLIVGFTFNPTYGQNLTEEQIDAIVLSYPKIKDITSLCDRINADFTDEKDKAFAIYIWMTVNIEYHSSKNYGNRKKLQRKRALQVIKNNLENQESNKSDKAENKLIKQTLKRNKTLDYGNAFLFYKICELCNIPCKIVMGAAKIVTPVGRRTKYYNNYAWNSIYIDNQWHVVDITYGSNAYGFSRSRLYENYSNVYFMTNPYFFHLNHFSSDTTWARYQVSSKEKFKLSYWPYTSLIEEEIKVVSPQFYNIKISSANIIITLENVKENHTFSYSLHDNLRRTQINPIFINDTTATLLLHDFQLEEGYLHIYCGDKPIITYYLNPIKHPDSLVEE